MQTCRKIVYDQQVTCYRTCYKPVRAEDDLVRYVPETKYRQCTYTVCKPVYETVQRRSARRVPAREVHADGSSLHGRGKTVPCSGPGAPATLKPAACLAIAARSRRPAVWVPEIQQKQVECVRYVSEVIRKHVPVQVCRMVAEQRVQQVPYTVCRQEVYPKVINCVRYVAEQVPYTVTRCVPRVVEVQVPVQVCKPVCRPAACAPVVPCCAPAEPACCGT